METKIYVVTEHNGIPEGACIEVKSESEETYDGIWVSDAGSYPVTVEKKFCKDIPQKVWLTEECDGAPEGSCIHVESETATTYTGICSSQLGSFPITVDKNSCRETSELQETLKNVSNYLKRKQKNMDEQQINNMNEQQFIDKFISLNDLLVSFGYLQGISLLNYGSRIYGHLYEDKRYRENGPIKPTPMNCLAVISHNNPDLIITLIHRHEFEEFLKIISQVGMCLEVFFVKFPGSKLPPELC